MGARAGGAGIGDAVGTGKTPETRVEEKWRAEGLSKGRR
jgi:hypothetical protein